MTLRTRIARFWNALGPGMITGAADNDPSAITAYSLAGSRFGFSMLWMLVWILPFTVAIQDMCARIGALSGCGLAGNIRRHYPAWLLVLAVGSIVVANTLNVGADIYGMAGALNLLLPHIPVGVLAVSVSALVLYVVVVFRYRRIEKIFKWVALCLFVYIIALVSVRPNVITLLWHAIIPTVSITREYLFTAFAVLGTTLSPYLYFWQASQEAEELKQDHPKYRICKFRPIGSIALSSLDLDTKIGMIVSNVISFAIIALTATVLSGTMVPGHTETLSSIASALKPAVGPFAYILFAVGIVGSGLLAIPVLAGSAAYALSEMMGWEASIDKPFTRARAFYLVMIGSVVVSMVVPFLGISPVQAMLWAAVVSGLSAPLLIALVVHMANNSDIVGPNRSRLHIHSLGIGALFLLLTGSLFVILS